MQKLSEIPEKSPFKVPENYFEEVSRKIISATSGYNQDLSKRGFYSRFRPYLAIAAGVAGFIILSYLTVNLVISNGGSSQLNEVLAGQNSEFYINDIDMYTLEENAASLGFTDDGPEVAKSDIIDCLLLENIEISDIYEQL